MGDEDEQIEDYLQELVDSISFTDDEIKEIFGACDMCGEVVDWHIYFEKHGEMNICMDCEEKLRPFLKWKHDIETELHVYRQIPKGRKLIKKIRMLYKQMATERDVHYELEQWCHAMERKFGWTLIFPFLGPLSRWDNRSLRWLEHVAGSRDPATVIKILVDLKKKSGGEP